MPLPLTPPRNAPRMTVQVFAAASVCVVQGVNRGETLGAAAEICAGDVYRLEAGGTSQRLTLGRAADGTQFIAEGSATGSPGATLAVSARLQLMAGDGGIADLLLIGASDGGLWVMPMAPMAQGADYTLIAISDGPGEVPLADMLLASFNGGTLITLADGRQTPIEGLAPGDMVLTRDHGPQPLRWIGRATLRATGDFAPVVISAGRLGNSGNLIVSPRHRVFLYQRRGGAGPGPAELLVQARDLVDGETVFRREGGFADYYSLVFDRHEIVFAEGIAAESLLVSEATVARLPAELAADLRLQFPGLSQSQHFGTESGRDGGALRLTPPDRPAR